MIRLYRLHRGHRSVPAMSTIYATLGSGLLYSYMKELELRKSVSLVLT